MSRVVGVKQVFVGVKIGGAVDQWIKAGCGIEVDNGHTPDVAGLFDALHICVEIFAAEVLYKAAAKEIAIVMPTTNCPTVHGTAKAGVAQLP